VAARLVRSLIPPANSDPEGAVPAGPVGSAYGAHLRKQAREDHPTDDLCGAAQPLPIASHPGVAFLPIMAADLEQTSVVGEKRRLRERMRALRLVADQKEGPDAALAVVRHFLAVLPELELDAGATVAGYWPIATELDVRPLLARLHERGIRCALPAIVAGAGQLLFRRWNPTDDFEPGHSDTRQPFATAETVIPQTLLVPLLAVDGMGHRLGYGRGWYDRTLAALRGMGRAVAIGVGYGVQRIERVPAAFGDKTVDWILTERAIERVGP
jgi:5-formyltetrahydrofolate cyclo-ligase